jgi:hypothetical protein
MTRLFFYAALGFIGVILLCMGAFLYVIFTERDEDDDDEYEDEGWQ